MKSGDQVYTHYFRYRNVDPKSYRDFRMPRYIRSVLPSMKNAKILDIGCGYGQMLSALKQMGYANLTGMDLSDEAVSFCRANSLDVIKVDSIEQFCLNLKERAKGYDFLIMSHVLEHIEKQYIIETLQLIKKHLMNPGSSLLILVPNAQSNTGCYWAYEDFTHETLFTAGSLCFVLKSAGFENVEFLDADGTRESLLLIKIIKKALLSLYKLNLYIWNRVTSSSYHQASPQIFTYELKALAK